MVRDVQMSRLHTGMGYPFNLNSHITVERIFALLNDVSDSWKELTYGPVCDSYTY